MIYDIKSEFSAIATALYNREALTLLMESTEDIFYHQNNRKLFNAVRELYTAGEEIDLLTLRHKLLQMGEYENVGGSPVIAELAQAHTTYNMPYVIRTLTKLQQRRKLQELSDLIEEKVKAPGVDVEEIFNQINETVGSLDNINNAEFVEIRQLVKDGQLLSDLDITGKYIQTGFKGIDSILIGLFKSEFIILAARPGCGKTALALNIAANVARDKKVLFISLEMKEQQLLLRLVSSESKVNSDFIRRGKLNDDEKQAVNSAWEQTVKHLNLSIVKTQSLDGIVSHVRKYARRHEIGLLVVDYLQLVRVNDFKNQRYVQVGEISRRFKLLGMELDIPILCLAQLSRSAEDKKPKLSDLRESGDIEQDADVVMFIHKDPALKGKLVNICFAKNRSGMADTETEMLFDKSCTKFYDVTYREDI